MDRNLISEIALRCDDISFRDFAFGIYEKCLLKASREVARRYHLIQRLYKFTFELNVSSDASNEEIQPIYEDIPVGIPSFVSEYHVKVNGQQFLKENLQKQVAGTYTLNRNQNQILFNYYPRTEQDEIHIYYTSDINEDDYDVEELMPIIPSQYNEELISIGTMEIGKLGMVKFAGSEKGEKYGMAYKVNAIDKVSLEKNLIKDDKWVEMKVYHAY
jgi:hypothetical protein